MLQKTLLCWKSMLKISACAEVYNACWKLCWKLGLFVCNSCIMCMLWKTLLCWKSMLKISACVEICNAWWKLCWKHVEKAYWKFQHMLKSVMHSETMLKACWKSMLKIQHVLKSVMHGENYVESMLKISMCVENYVKNVYVNHVENQVENCVEVQKKTNQFNFLVEIYTIFWFGRYFKLQEVRNYVWKQSRIFEK